MDAADNRNLPKHSRYQSAYQRFGFYWGLGVEHETYIMTSQIHDISGFTTANMKPERYSVSYYKNYRKEALMPALQSVLQNAGGSLSVPVLMNNHSLVDCDLSGEHRTTYEREPKPNPRYAGYSVYDYLCSHSVWLRDQKERAFTWDGDTVEFMTQEFYKATVDSVMAELNYIEWRFVAEMNKVPGVGVLASHGPFSLGSPRNEPFATYLTNPRAVSMFNNGTFHVNATLPTRLGFDRRPLRWTDFVEKHRRLARLVQWMEPLWIAVFGSGDPLAAVADGFAAGSQRLAVSRYIGVGTFDTVAMPTGKILQMARPTSLPWYDVSGSAYAPLDVIGLDINFNKHWAHGLELRIFDQMPMDSLRSVLEHVVLLMDLALSGGPVADPRFEAEWQAAARSAIFEGGHWVVSAEQWAAFCSVFGILVEPLQSKEPVAVLSALMKAVKEQRRGLCWSLMVGGLHSVEALCY
jgi:hypothetical protein